MFLWHWNDSSSFPKIRKLAFSERAIENSREVALVTVDGLISVFNRSLAGATGKDRCSYGIC